MPQLLQQKGDALIHVVGLLAKAGHGKTTVANFLRDYYGAEIVSLAAPLKQIAKVVMDFSDAQLYGTQEEKEAIDPRYGFSCRTFLQRLGTEGIRENLGPLVWCEALALKMQTRARRNGTRVFVIDDMRFRNEVEFVNRLDRRERTTGSPAIFGHTIKLLCTDAPVMASGSAHASEAEMDLIEPHELRACVRSSRAQGVDHLISEFDETLTYCPELSGLKAALLESRRQIVLAETLSG